jgi:transposase-like protein
MTCLKCKHYEAKRFGFYGRKRIQRYRCPGWQVAAAQFRKTPLGGPLWVFTKGGAVLLCFFLISIFLFSKFREFQAGA